MFFLLTIFSRCGNDVVKNAEKHKGSSNQRLLKIWRHCGWGKGGEWQWGVKKQIVLQRIVQYERAHFACG